MLNIIVEKVCVYPDGKVWMAENLAYLPEVSPPDVDSYSDPFYYVYGYNGENVDDAKATDNFKIFGVLYNLAAAEESCPEGWRLTESSDWEELSQYISIMNNGYEKVGYTWRNVGKRLKSTGTIIDGNGLWGKDAAEYEGTDDYGFSGLPGGYRHLDNIFKEIGLHGYWWLKSWSSSGSWWGAKLSYFNSDLEMPVYQESAGYSVR